MGDGESLNLGFGVQEKGVEIEDIKVEVQSQDNSRLISALPTSNTSQNGQLSVMYTLKHSQDTKDYQYRIVEGYRPVKDTYSYETNAMTDPVPVDGMVSPWDTSGSSSSGSAAGSWIKTHTDELLSTDFQWRFRQYVDEPEWYETRDTEYDDYYELIYTPTGEVYCYYYDTTDDQLRWPNKYGSSDPSGFSRKRDTSLDGKTMSESEFESNAWYYCPGGDYGRGNHVVVSEKIMTTNINAVKEISTDTSVKSTKQTDILRITVKRTIEGQGSEDKVFQIPIYTETRGCVYNYE